MTDMQMISAAGEDTLIAEEQVQAFENSLLGQLIRPGDADYDEARAVWNGMIDKRPALIAKCAGTADVIYAVNFAREHNLLISVRGGGHNVAGAAVAEGGLVIDLTNMKGIQIDPETRIARAQPGVIWGELDHEAQAFGLATPGGLVSDTGIAGLTLGGGLGWLRNKYGLSCDALISADVVTADGRLIKANANENADLFWGLRGGGGNFGIVTNFEYQLYPLDPEVIFVFVFHQGDRAKEALQFYREYVANAPDEVSSIAVLGRIPADHLFPQDSHGMPFVLFGAMYSGPAEEGKRILQPLRDFGIPITDFSGVMSYQNEVQKIFDEDYPSGELRYYWRSTYLKDLDDAAIDRLIALQEDDPSNLSTLDIWHIGGAVQRVGATETAFGDRSASFMIGIESNWEDADADEANINWNRRVAEELQPFSTGGQYLNFPGFYEEGEDQTRDAFGRNYQRLVALKDKYDPTNLFSQNQNIKPSNT